MVCILNSLIKQNQKLLDFLQWLIHSIFFAELSLWLSVELWFIDLVWVIRL